MNVLALETCWAKIKASEISWSVFVQLESGYVIMFEPVFGSWSLDRYILDIGITAVSSIVIGHTGWRTAEKLRYADAAFCKIELD